MSVLAAPVWASVLGVGAVLLAGAYLAAVLDVAWSDLVAGERVRPRQALMAPVRRAALLASQQRIATERPDHQLWALAPAAYAALAAVALTVVPLAPGVVVADLRGGIVLFGAAEALVLGAVYLHGWGPNSGLPLIAGYRFVAAALSYELLSMFVLIAAALPAQSLAVSEIVRSQENLWNVLRQPLGLPLWLVVSLGVTFLGPVDYADSPDLAGGTVAEASGPQRLLWLAARGAMLVTFAALGAAVFLGGWLGPWLPDALWMIGKTVLLLGVLLGLRHLVARPPIERFVSAAWTLLLPLAFLDLLVAGVVALP